MQQKNMKPKRPLGIRLRQIVKKDIRTIKKATDEAPVNLYEHLTDDRFSHKHKIRVGVVVMVIGVTMAKMGHFVPNSFVLVMITDVVGYFFHGYGSVAIIEFFHHKAKIKHEKRKPEKEN